MLKIKHKMSIMVKIILLSSVLILFTTLTMHIVALNTAEKTITHTMGQTALKITQSVVNTIDTEQYIQLQTEADIEKEYYNYLREEFKKIKESTGLKFLYTMRKVSTNQYIYVVDGSDMDDPNFSSLGDAADDDISDAIIACFYGQETYELTPKSKWGPTISAYIPIYHKGEVIGILGADFDAEYFMNQLEALNHTLLIPAGIITLIGIMAGLLFSFLIVQSMKKLQMKIKLVQQGDLTTSVINKRNDEVGELSQAFQTMIDKMAWIIKGIRNNTQDVTSNINLLNNNINENNLATEEITKIINEIASGAEEQVCNVNNVSQSIEKVFTELESITININHVNEDSEVAKKESLEVSEILKSSVEQINLVNDTVDTTAHMMKQLEEKFQEILNFSSSVSAIASQTNLLALNASIEAASAGEHGRGFGIVASEIKKLAKQSSDASKRINDLIKVIQEEINNSSNSIEKGVIQARDGVQVIAQVENYFNKVSDSNKKLNLHLKEVTEAIITINDESKEILDNIVSLSKISNDFSAGTQQVAAETEEQLAVMEIIKNNFSIVKGMMEELSATVNTFRVD